MRGETPVALDLIEEEEAERVSELHQRETLLINMGVVNQVRQLLQSANHLTELINHSREQTNFPSHCRHDHKVCEQKNPVLKEWFTPKKKKILSLFTNPYDVSNLYNFLF